MQKTKDVIRSAQARAGLFRQTAKMCKMACIEPRTFANRLDNSGSIKLSELRRLNRVLHFTDDEILEMVKNG